MAFSDKRPIKAGDAWYVFARDPETEEVKILKADDNDPNGTWSALEIGGQPPKCPECSIPWPWPAPFLSSEIFECKCGREFEIWASVNSEGKYMWFIAGPTVRVMEKF